MTKILTESGLTVPKEQLMRPNIHLNPGGYYENINIVKINDQLIRLKNKNNASTFLNILEPSTEHFELLSTNNYTEYDTEAKVYKSVDEIKHTLTTEHVIKDSRFALTLQDWGLDEVFIIKIKRNRQDVKKSMIRHYGNFFESDVEYMQSTIHKIDFDTFYDFYDSKIDELLKNYRGVEITYEDLVNYKIDRIGAIPLHLDSITKTCSWCKHATRSVYTVPNSRTGARIMYCTQCQLLQSVYANLENKHRYKSISCDSDWGNIRHGKGVRLSASVEILDGVSDIKSILDIGSNRGNFCEWASGRYSDSMIDMIEPDGNVSHYKFRYDNLYTTRFEHFFKNMTYDLVYCCHTLEHLDDLHDFFRKSRKFSDKYLLIDVPNIAALSLSDTVEEFFIDKHTYHFSESGLIDMLKFYGFRVIRNHTDQYNIVVLCRKDTVPFSLDVYSQTLHTNRQNLKKVAVRINTLIMTKKTVLYGVTRIYDALVKYGGLKYLDAHYLVDDFSPLENIHKSEKLTVDTPEVVVILARSSIEKIKTRVPVGVETITFQELLQSCSN